MKYFFRNFSATLKFCSELLITQIDLNVFIKPGKPSLDVFPLSHFSVGFSIPSAPIRTDKGKSLVENEKGDISNIFKKYIPWTLKKKKNWRGEIELFREPGYVSQNRTLYHEYGYFCPFDTWRYSWPLSGSTLLDFGHNLNLHSRCFVVLWSFVQRSS